MNFFPVRFPASQLLLFAMFLVAVNVQSACAQLDFERPPINYSTSEPKNCISELIAKIDSGELQLEHDPQHGYLKSLLKHLDVSVESQTLVFSKTSRQRTKISPHTPRAIYFNDDVYIGWVNGGKAIEISAADPKLGAVFYSLDQNTLKEKPAFTRQLGQCLICHASTHTSRIPGHIVRSVYTDYTGQPIVGSFTFNTTDQSPISERWGGWYVTGTHGTQRHMGNLWAARGDDWREIDFEDGANVVDLSEKFKVSDYLSPHSDIVALMVLEHQTAMHNKFTAANIQWRKYWQEAREINQERGDPPDHLTAESKERLHLIGKEIVDGLLMKDEALPPDPVKGTSRFEQTFAALAPHDELGRSLRQFDLKKRLFKYRCSYMIYSDAFDALPDPVRESVYQLLWTTLNTDKKAEEYAIKRHERRSVIDILRATKKDLPDFWHVESNSSPKVE